MASAVSLKVVAIDTDETPELADHFGVTDIPTLLLVQDGKVLEKVVGAVPKSALLTMLRNKFAGLQVSGTAS